MNFKKSILMMLYVTIILGLVSHAYSADKHGTYTGTLTEGANPVDIYVGGEYMGEYSDYKTYQVNLDKDQKVELKLEVPAGADFDLFVYTQDETQGWSNVSDTLGEDEELNVTAPKTGAYKFVVAAWSGSGQFTLNWETPGAGLSIPIYALIGIPIVVGVVIVFVLLLRGKTRPPPAPVYAPPPVSAPMSAPEVPETPQSQCPDCGGTLTWIEQYQRWYCYKCSKYV